MVGLMYRPVIVLVEVGVQWRGGEVRLAKHFLHGFKVLDALEQVRRDRVPEGVRRYPLRQPGEAGRSLDDAPRAHPRQGRAAGVEKHQPASLPLVEAGGGLPGGPPPPPPRPPPHPPPTAPPTPPPHTRATP